MIDPYFAATPNDRGMASFCAGAGLAYPVMRIEESAVRASANDDRGAARELA